MKATTIKLYKKTKQKLDQFKEYKNESYDEIVNKLVYIAANTKKHPELSEEAIKAIEAARKRMDNGEYYTHEEVKRSLGL